METDKKLGERLRSLREEQGLSVFDLSLKAGMREQTLRFWENGQRDCSMPDVLFRVAMVLGTTLDYLVAGRGPKYFREAV